MVRCDLRVRWQVASDLRFRAAISEPEIPFFCGISGDLAPSTRKSLANAIVRFWCTKDRNKRKKVDGGRQRRTEKKTEQVTGQANRTIGQSDNGRRWAEYVSESTVSNTKLSEFFALTEFWAVSSSQPVTCVQTRPHRVLRRTHRVCRKSVR